MSCIRWALFRLGGALGKTEIPFHLPFCFLQTHKVVTAVQRKKRRESKRNTTLKWHGSRRSPILTASWPHCPWVPNPSIVFLHMHYLFCLHTVKVGASRSVCFSPSGPWTRDKKREVGSKVRDTGLCKARLLPVEIMEEGPGSVWCWAATWYTNTYTRNE